MRHAPPALPLTSPADSQVSSGERAGQSEPRRRTPRGNLRSLAMCFFLVFFCVCFPLVFFPLYLMADRWRGDIRRLFFLTPAAFVSKVSRPASGGYWVKTCPRVFILSVGGTWIVGGGAVGGRVEATQRQRICDTLSVLMRPFVGVSEEHLSPPPPTKPSHRHRQHPFRPLPNPSCQRNPERVVRSAAAEGAKCLMNYWAAECRDVAIKSLKRMSECLTQLENWSF